MRYRVLPYKQGSKSAKALASALGGKVLKLHGSSFVPKAGDVLINWGRSNYPFEFAMTDFLNEGAFIEYVSNKLNFFELMKGAHPDVIPTFWTNKEDIPAEAYPVVCRTILTGHSGAGIVIADTPEALVDAPLYVKYVKKKDEYRVHIGKTRIDYDSVVYTTIAVQRKARRLDHENPNWRVRNHANGFVFVRNDVNPPSCVLDVARQAILASSLDFGAVDVIWNEEQEKAYVLEINTAPGLEGQTVTDYASFFKGVAGDTEHVVDGG